MIHGLATAAAIAIALLAMLCLPLALRARAISRAADRAAPPTGRFATIGGVRLHFTDQGDGSPVVLIHGLAGNSRNFTFALAGLLARRHRVIAVDRPGSGHSPAIPGGFSLARHADLVAGLIEQAGAAPAIVVGHSLGGAVALRLAVDRPDLIARLALIVPAVAPIEVPPPAFARLAIRSALLRRVIAGTVGPIVAQRTAARGAAGIFGPDPAPPDFMIRGGAILARRSANIVTIATELCDAPVQLAELEALISQITVPVAALGALGDRVLDPRLHLDRLRALVPNARVRHIDGGHMLPATRPGVVADWITG